MSTFYRKSVFLCRAIFCKHKNVVYERVDSNENVIETAPAWKHRCGGCGRGSFDLIYQQVMKPNQD